MAWLLSKDINGIWLAKTFLLRHNVGGDRQFLNCCVKCCRSRTRFYSCHIACTQQLQRWTHGAIQPFLRLSLPLELGLGKKGKKKSSFSSPFSTVLVNFHMVFNVMETYSSVNLLAQKIFKQWLSSCFFAEMEIVMSKAHIEFLMVWFPHAYVFLSRDIMRNVRWESLL